MINEATIRNARYYPELLPDTRIATITAGSELSPPVLNLRQFTPKLLQLVDLSVRRADMEIRLRYDSSQYTSSASAMPDLAPAPWDVVAANLLTFNLYSSAGVNSVPLSYGIWVYKPTVAHKIKHNLKLTPDEEKLATELGIVASVEKGVLPLPLTYLIDREYQVLEKVSKGVTVNITANEATIDAVPAKPGEILVLTELAANPGAAPDNIRVRIDRDTDANYLELHTSAMSLDRGIPCFVPALSEIRIKIVANNAVNNHPIRYTIMRCVKTNTLLARFGLAGPSELPGDVWKKVQGGVL